MAYVYQDDALNYITQTLPLSRSDLYTAFLEGWSFTGTKVIGWMSNGSIMLFYSTAYSTLPLLSVLILSRQAYSGQLYH